MIEKLKTVLAAYEYHIKQTRPIDRSVKAIAYLRSVIAEMEAEQPAAYLAYSPTKGNGLRLFLDKKDARRYADDLSPLFTHPQPKQRLC